MFFGSLTQYPFGLAVDKFPKQKINFIFIGGLVSAIAMCIFAQFNSMIMFFILTMVMGIFSSISRASGIAIRTGIIGIIGTVAATIFLKTKTDY